MQSTGRRVQEGKHFSQNEALGTAMTTFQTIGKKPTTHARLLPVGVSDALKATSG